MVRSNPFCRSSLEDQELLGGAEKKAGLLTEAYVANSIKPPLHLHIWPGSISSIFSGPAIYSL